MQGAVIFVVSICLLFFAYSAACAVTADDILGLWNNEEQDAVIEVFKCGDTAYCGKIKWLKEPNYTAEDNPSKTGSPKIDDNNSNPALRNRPILGLQILEGMSYTGGNVWDGGSIYDPETGRTYKAKVRLVSPDKLKLRGFIGISLFGRKTVWTRKIKG